MSRRERAVVRKVLVNMAVSFFGYLMLEIFFIRNYPAWDEKRLVRPCAAG
jgi:hypothetical protein